MHSLEKENQVYTNEGSNPTIKGERCEIHWRPSIRKLTNTEQISNNLGINCSWGKFDNGWSNISERKN